MGSGAEPSTREWLLQELERVRAHRVELESHVHEEARLVRELADVEQALVEHGQAPKRLPLLDGMHVATPCTQSWDAMTGDDRTRHCRACNKDVHDISALSREAAEAFLQRVGGEGACVRFYQRADGTVLSQGDCSVGVRARWRPLRIGAGIGAALAGIGAAAFWLTAPVATECEAGPVMGGWMPPANPHPPPIPDPIPEPYPAPEPTYDPPPAARRCDPSADLERFTKPDGTTGYRCGELPRHPKKPPPRGPGRRID